MDTQYDTNALEIFCKVMGWSGGTIHQAKERFAVASIQEQDKICSALIANMSRISDIETVKYFTDKRLENLRMINVAARYDAKQEDNEDDDFHLTASTGMTQDERNYLG